MRVLITLNLSLCYWSSFSTAFVNYPITVTRLSKSILQNHDILDDNHRITVRASSLDVDISKDNYNSDDVNGTLWTDPEKGIASTPSSTVVETDGVVSLPVSMLELPRHLHNEGVNTVLLATERYIRTMHKDSKAVDPKSVKRSMTPKVDVKVGGDGAHAMDQQDAIFANTYVDLGKVDTVGFDYDYTLVHYTDELLELLYDMALKRLVNDRHYPLEMLESALSYDPFFSIRGELPYIVSI
jgi:hypothetical protein